MSNVTIWHNPRCSKSRQTLALLQERGIEPAVVRYLEEPPGPETLDRVLQQLGMEPRDLMRKREAPYVVHGLSNPRLSRSALIAAMVEYPQLIERPVVITGDRAALGRPPENVLALFDDGADT